MPGLVAARPSLRVGLWWRAALREHPIAVFFVRRLALTVLVLLTMTVVTFTLVAVVPGDPARTAAGRNATPAQVAIVRHRLGLDRPIWTQYLTYLGDLAHGNLGTSIVTQRPITTDLRAAVPPSVELVVAAMLINLLIAVPLGILAALKQGTVVDSAVRLLVISAGGVPVFWLGLVLQLGFGAMLGWLPIAGQVNVALDTGREITGLLTVDAVLQGHWAAADSAFQHLILPSIALAALEVALLTRIVRSSMITVMEQDFIVLARAKGISELRVVVRHGLRNALIPSVTVIGMQAGYMMAGTVLVESIFGRPGLGAYAVNAVLFKDLWAIVAVVLVVGIVFVVGNLAVDFALMRLDPKLRPSHDGGR